MALQTEVLKMDVANLADKLKLPVGSTLGFIIGSVLFSQRSTSDDRHAVPSMLPESGDAIG